MDDTQFRTWKTQLVPLLYDWFSNHNLTWPTQACRWGPRLDEATYKYRYRLYLSEQTDAKYKEPPKLLVVDADICKPRVASTEAVATWTEFSKCPYVKDYKTIIHPGEVNKIRELPQHPEIIVTHTDAPELYVWNVERQPDQKKGADKRWPPANHAELVLTGHEKDAQFPLATCNAAPMVASGGTDKLVLLWDLQDAMEGILAKDNKAEKRTELGNRTRLEGHKKTVEDLVFKPGTPEQLVSVGDDTQILFWDTRSGTTPVCSVGKAHNSQDIHTVDWSGLQEHLLVTGAADGSLKVWDRRQLGTSNPNGSAQALKVFNFHTDAIMRVEWHPSAQGVLASGGEDHLVVVWDMERSRGSSLADAGAPSSSKGKSPAPPEVMFKHVGHRSGKVVDFQWCPSEPWTMLSVSDDTDTGDEEAGMGRGGGTLQMWRISDLIYLPEEEVVKELESHREWILNGKNPPKQNPKQSAANGVKAKADIPTGAASAGTSGAGAVAAEAAGAKMEAGPAAAADTGAATGSGGAGQGQPAAAVKPEPTSQPSADAASGKPEDSGVGTSNAAAADQGGAGGSSGARAAEDAAAAGGGDTPMAEAVASDQPVKEAAPMDTDQPEGG